MRSIRYVGGIVTVACVMALSMTGPVADTFAAGADPSDEPASRLERLRAKGREAIHALRDKRMAKEDRLREFKNIIVPDKEDFDELFHIFKDRDEDDDVRWAALRHQPLDENLIAAELDVLRDVRNGSARFHAKLLSDLGGRARLQHHSRIFQNVMQTARGLLRDEREEVRQAAFRFLTPMQDPTSTQLVIDGLRNPRQALIPSSQAIELLHVAGAAKRAAGVIGSYLDDPDAIVRAKAALAAAIDPGSRPKIVRLLKDRRQPDEVRLAALRGLSGSDPAFPSYALEIMKDAAEEDDIRKAAINRFVGFMNYHTVSKNHHIEFRKVIREIAVKEGTGPGTLGEVAQQVSSYIQRNFPTISE
ncbi:MAG: hypothetical protein ACREJU_14260 [Nitrospiraceae bacterium]